MHVSALNIYPVKSLRGISLKQGVLTHQGLVGDRLWMVTDDKYNFITQRQIPKMATIEVSLTENTLSLFHASTQPLNVDRHRTLKDLVHTEVWGNACQAFDEGEQAAQWLTNILGCWQGKSLRLVRFNDAYTRVVRSKYLQGEQAFAAFSDEYPFLVTSTASLDAVNDALVEAGNEPLMMNRFRPNIVVTLDQSFAEHAIKDIEEVHGRYIIGMRKACKRCSITTTDQTSGEIFDSLEPIQTLRRINPQPKKVGAYFGQNSTLVSGENQTIKIGDLLTFGA